MAREPTLYHIVKKGQKTEEVDPSAEAQTSHISEMRKQKDIQICQQHFCNVLPSIYK